MTFDKANFQNFVFFPVPIKVQVANGHTIEAFGYGKASIPVLDGANLLLRLENVWHVPDITRNLFSTREATKRGSVVIFANDNCFISQAGTPQARATSRSGLYQLCVNGSARSQVGQAYTTVANLQTWHRHLGYASVKRLQQWAKGLAQGVGKVQGDLPPYETCIKRKMHRKSVGKTAMPRATKLLKRVYTDVCGPMHTASMSGAKYLLIFVDDCTRYTWVRFIRQKSDVAKVTADWERMVTNRFGCSIKTIHSNNGGEYIGKEFQDWMASRGILHEPTALYTPEHNGVAE